MTEREKLADEAACLEDNIATVAFHLGQPGARLSVQHDKSGLIVDPGDTLKEISRRLEPPPPIPDGRIALEALEPFARISLIRDSDPGALNDMIDAPDLAITPKDVRRARAALRALPSGETGR